MKFILGTLAPVLTIAAIHLLTQSCAPDQPILTDNKVSGAILPIVKEASVARKMSDAEFTNFRRRIIQFRYIHIGSSSPEARRFQLSGFLARAILDSGGIHPDQLHRVLRQLLDQKTYACGGASCSTVLGIEPDNINKFLDETLKKIESSVSSGKSSLSESQIRALVSSLRRPRLMWQLNGFEVPVPPPGTKNAVTEYDGLCPLPLIQSVGLRTNPGIEMQETRLTSQSKVGFVDYRRREAPGYQGVSGACHAFAMASFFSHSKYSQLASARQLSPERLLIENWIINLGNTPEEAAKRDLKKLNRLAEAFRKARSPRGSLSEMDPNEATQTFLSNNYIDLSIIEQGGNALRNWSFINKKGALMKGSGAPPLTMAMIEDLTRSLTKTRISVLRSILMFGLDALTSDGLAKSLVQAYEPIFRLEKQGHGFSRDLIRDELAAFKIQSYPFRRGQPEQSLGMLIKNLIKYGPVFGATANHAFTIVGYDSKNRHFLVRDSQLNNPSSYEEIPAEEIAANLVSYQAIEPR